MPTTYIKCEKCPLFVDPNHAHDPDDAGDDLAPWVHLSRGDDADEAYEDHDATPDVTLGARTLAYWLWHGPLPMRARFALDAAEKIAEGRADNPKDKINYIVDVLDSMRGMR